MTVMPNHPPTTISGLPSGAPPLAWRGVSFQAGGRAILENLTLEVPAGGVLALVGPSGCGKTTLLALAAGLRRPAAGQVAVTACRVASMFQDARLLPWRRARHNAAFGLRCLGVGRRARLETAEALLESLGLAPEDGDKFPHELSGGMRQRVALARALAIEPDLLLLDEPFSALDAVRRRDLQDLVRAAVTERAVTTVFVTHDLFEAVRVSDRIAVMAGGPGRVVHVTDLTATPRDDDDGDVLARVRALRTHPAVAAAFGPGRSEGLS